MFFTFFINKFWKLNFKFYLIYSFIYNIEKNDYLIRYVTIFFIFLALQDLNFDFNYIYLEIYHGLMTNC